jgi:hypothetical protein
MFKRSLKAIPIVLLFLFIGCSTKLDINVDAEIVDLGTRSVGGKITGLAAGALLGYNGMHRTIGVKFEIDGHKFVEQIRITKVIWEEYNDSETIPLRIHFVNEGYTIHIGPSDGLAKPRYVSSVVWKDIKERRKGN